MHQLIDSGVKWIGDIPSHWTVENPRWHFVQRKDRAKPGMTQVTASQKYGVITQEEYMDITGSNIVTVQKDFDILKMVCEGDFVIHMRSFQGGLEYSERTGSISSAYVMLIPQATIAEPRYYKWYFKSANYIDALSSTSNLVRDGQAMRYSNFVQLPILLPPAEEQRKIADFLDDKCKEVDALILDIQQQIDLLLKYKKSIIFETVTKGIRCDVTLKDSGAAWIGNVPNHWQIDKFKYHLVRNEPRNPGNAIVLSLYRELGIIPKDSRDDNHNQTSEDTSKYKYVRPGNFVVNKMKAWQGSVAVSEYEGIISPAYYVYAFKSESFLKRYFHYLLRGCYKDEFMRLSGGMRVGQWDLAAEDLENTVVLIPPMEEQISIANFLDKKCEEIDAFIASKEEQISILESLKKSIIFEYVTGKKEVDTVE